MSELSKHVYYSSLHELNYFTGINHTTKLSWTMTNNKLYGSMDTFIKLESNEFRLSYLVEIISDLKKTLIDRDVSHEDVIFFKFDNIIFNYEKLNFNLDKFVNKKVNQLLKFGYPDVNTIFDLSWFDAISDYQFPIIDPLLSITESKFSKVIKLLHKNFKSGTIQGITYELEDQYLSSIEHSLSDYKLIDNIITKNFDVFMICPLKNQHMYDSHQLNIVKSELRNIFTSYNVMYM